MVVSIVVYVVVYVVVDVVYIVVVYIVVVYFCGPMGPLGPGPDPGPKKRLQTTW